MSTKATTNGTKWAWHNLTRACSTRFDLTVFSKVVLEQLSKFYAKLCTNVQISLSLFKYTWQCRIGFGRHRVYFFHYFLFYQSLGLRSIKSSTSKGVEQNFAAPHPFLDHKITLKLGRKRKQKNSLLSSLCTRWGNQNNFAI